MYPKKNHRFRILGNKKRNFFLFYYFGGMPTIFFTIFSNWIVLFFNQILWNTSSRFSFWTLENNRIFLGFVLTEHILRIDTKIEESHKLTFPSNNLRSLLLRNFYSGDCPQSPIAKQLMFFSRV
ncbi:hypothetical protein HanIR_Chr10g0497441 [Helianthus annuus]|nr:hypothetical protein HanIR_Chr10g0497441 [Helianthus annuus]